MTLREWILAELIDILPVGLKYHRAQMAGILVFDNYDQNLEGCTILETSVEKRLKQGNVKSLRKTLEYLIRYFECEDKYGFGAYLFERTGYQLNPIPKENLSQSYYRKLYLSVSGDRDRAITTLQILLRAGSGIIYSIRGSYPKLKSRWIDDHTIEIEIPGPGEEIYKVHKVTTETEVFKIVYKEDFG